LNVLDLTHNSLFHILNSPESDFLSLRYLEAMQGMKETTIDFCCLSTHQLIMKGDGYVRRYVSRDGRS
jgi:hypothetical protein